MAAVERQQQLFQHCIPISELSSYQAKWVIRGRITDKAPLRTFNKSGGAQGRVFHVNVLDAEGGEIRACFFNEAADKFFDKVERGKCYTMSKGAVRIANRQYNPCNHRYEIVFDKVAEVDEAPDDGQIEAVKFHFVDLRTVQDRPTPCTVDICGVVAEAKPTFAFTSKDGKSLVKREIIVADDSAVSMSVTLWGDRAQTDDSAFQGNPVVCVKSVMVKEWNGGRAGSLAQNGALLLGEKECAKIPQVSKVQAWWMQGGNSQDLKALSKAGGSGGGRSGSTGKAVDISEMRASAANLRDQTEICTVHCRLALVQTKKQGEAQPLYYVACAEPKESNGLPCNRRLDPSGVCPVCNRTGKSAVRLNLRCRFADYGDNCWLTTFDEAAQSILDLTGEKAQEIEQGEGGRDALEAALRARYFSGGLLELTVRYKLDTYGGELKPNITCIGARPASRGQRGRAMLREIQELLA